MNSAASHLGPFAVIELRRYTLVDGERPAFSTYFETFFPEAFQQLGALVLGHFAERDQPNTFTWLRAFADMDAHARVKSAFYYGPLWKEHRATMNDRLLDWQNALLLQPLDADRPVAVLPAVDPVREPAGARGVAVAQLLPVRDDAARPAALAAFAAYRAAGARELAALGTLDAVNTFPQHPVRGDGPWIAWLGVLPDEAARADFAALAERASAGFASAGLLRGAPELVWLDPAPRSRWRWLPA
jgi:hypothetical protein